jgi:hypothetical protein
MGRGLREMRSHDEKAGNIIGKMKYVVEWKPIERAKENRAIDKVLLQDLLRA